MEEIIKTEEELRAEALENAIVINDEDSIDTQVTEKYDASGSRVGTGYSMQLCTCGVPSGSTFSI